MKKFIVLLGLWWAITPNNMALANYEKNRPLDFYCQGKDTDIRITIRAKPNYLVGIDNRSTTGGDYYKIGRTTYRFKTGDLKGNSLIQKRGKIYLVATESEAKAVKLSNAVLACKKQSLATSRSSDIKK